MKDKQGKRILSLVLIMLLLIQPHIIYGVGAQGEEDSSKADTAKQALREPSDGSLAGQTMKFINLYWKTDDLGDVEAVFSGGEGAELAQLMKRTERGIYITEIPEGDYSIVSFRRAGDTTPFPKSSYNYYGAVSQDSNVKTTSFREEENNTFYYDMGENPSYWGSDPEYEVTEPQVLKTRQITFEPGKPQPGQMVYAIDLDMRERYLKEGNPEIENETYRIHIAFMKKDHGSIEDLSQLTPEQGKIYTMYEKSPGVYSAPFPENVNDYSEIGFKLVDKATEESSPLNEGARHYNFRGEEPEGQETAKFGYFKYYSGYTDTFYMNSRQNDSYWGAHPSNADQSLDTQVLYINVEDSDVPGEAANNNKIADPDNMWISWNNMPQGKKDDKNFDTEKGWKVTNTLPHKWIRYFQFPKNSNATENTIFTLHFTLTELVEGTLTEEEKNTEYTYKFTLVPRSQRNRLNLDYIWEFNGRMWDHFQAGEGLESKTIFFTSVRNTYKDVWVRVAKEDSEYANEDEIKKWSEKAGWTAEWIQEHVAAIDGTTWLKLDKVDNAEAYNKDEGKLFNLTIPGAYTKIQFRTELDEKFYYSNKETITTESAYPCYFSYQIGEASANVPEEDKEVMGLTGYWASVYAVNASGDQSVDIPNDQIEWEEGVYYADATFYDYYSDVETTGRKVAEWEIEGTEGIQNHYRRQAQVFNAALDDYYREQVDTPLKSDVPALYATTLGDPGAEKNIFNGNKPYWNYNNRMKKFGDGTTLDRTTYQNNWTGSNQGPFTGLVEEELAEDGSLLINGGTTDTDSGIKMPFFNEDFLRGNNSMDTAVGNVYKNVKFPITKDKDGDGYWVYDSSRNEDALRISYDVDEGYFMKRTNDGITFRGRNAFYPFNDADDWAPNYNIDEGGGNSDTEMAKANCLFGTRMEFEFSLTEDGKVINMEGEEVPITFEFQGDDDTWIFIDDHLALDLGGVHDAVRGTIDFADLTYTVKRGLGDNYEGEGQEVYVYPEKEGEQGTTLTDVPLSVNVKETLKDRTKTHKLTLFYMERGLYESNLKLTFNFPRDNRFIVEKEVDVESTRQEGEDIFAGLLENMGSFNFNLQNLVTSGKALSVEESAGYKKPGENTPLFSAITDPPVEAKFSIDGKTDEEAGISKDTKTGVVTVNQEAVISGQVPNEKTLLKIQPKEPINVAEKDYLRLSMKNLGATDRNASNLYLSFVDTSGKRVGGYAGALNYNGEYNTFLANQESILRVNFKEMTGDPNFDWRNVAYMLIGIRRVNEKDRAEYEISYASFYERTVEKPHIGLFVDDSQISDYGSYESGKLSPVDGAWYIKQDKTEDGSYGTGVSWNTEEGTFNLADGQRAVFTDKFRTGSYIALKENREPKIFDTEWTLTEAGENISANDLLASRNDVTTVKNPISVIQDGKEYPYLEVDGDEIADGREEIIDPKWENAGKVTAPDNAIVYRSYRDPDSSANIGTDLSVTVKNTLKRGSLTIKKQLTEGSIDPETNNYKPADFTFKIYYTDIAGRGLEKQLDPINENNRYLLQTVKVHTDETGKGEITIPNIPAGTKYHIVEVPANGTKLEYIEIGQQNLHENVEIKGVIGEKDYSQAYVTGTAYASDQAVTFTNRIVPFYMDIEKIWNDGLTDDERAELGIDEVHIQLQRRIQGSQGDWEVVTKDYFEKQFVDDEKGAYIKLNKENKWKTTSTKALPVECEEGSDKGKYYEYRIVELNHKNIFQRYEVSYDQIRNQDYQPAGSNEKYLHVTYQAINTPAELLLKKEWKGQDLSSEQLPSMVRVKLLASDKYDPENPNSQESLKPENWVCYKKVSNPYHSCDSSCYIELNARSDWRASMRNLVKKNKDEEPYYYKLAEEQIFINGAWQETNTDVSLSKPDYGTPVPLENIDSGEDTQIATVSVENSLTSGNIKIIKKSKGQEAEEGTPLKDVEFKLELLKWNEDELPDEIKEEEFGKLEVNSEFPSKTGITDKNGTFTFSSLPYGIYRITEAKTPSGHISLKKPVYLILSDRAFEKQAEEHKGDPSYDANSRTITVTIINEKALVLPTTGHRGVFKFTLAGVVLFGAAALMYRKRLMRLRKRQH